MKIPESFKAELQLREQKRKKEELEKVEEEERYQERLKKHMQEEKRKEKSEIEICKKIFDWKDEFLRTEEGIKLINQSDGELWVFNGTWAITSKLPRYEGSACWSRIYFTQKTINYHQGYKWMPTGPNLTFSEPEEMARKIDYKYLKEFLQEIESGKIFDTILERTREVDLSNNSTTS